MIVPACRSLRVKLILFPPVIWAAYCRDVAGTDPCTSWGSDVRELISVSARNSEVIPTLTPGTGRDENEHGHDQKFLPTVKYIFIADKRNFFRASGPRISPSQRVDILYRRAIYIPPEMRHLLDSLHSFDFVKILWYHPDCGAVLTDHYRPRQPNTS